MKFDFKFILWGLLVVFLVMASSSFFLRWNNEQANLTIVNVADYNAFNLSANFANRDIDDVLIELRDAGIQAIGIREVTIRDMAERGLIQLQAYGHFLGWARIQEAGLFEFLQSSLAEYGTIGTQNLVAISTDADTSNFLYERLSARYLSQAQAAASGRIPEFFHFSYDGTDYFITNTELLVVGAIRDVQLGFDENLMAHLTDMGFSLVLRCGMNTGSNNYFWQEYEYFISRFNIKTIVFSNMVFNGTPDCVEKAADLVNRHEIVIGVAEPPDQIGFVNQPGLVPLMQMTDFPINRVYSTTNDEFVTRTRDRYYRWVRGVIDRNIRIMYISPFQNFRVSASTNLDDTIATIAEFTATMEDRGYVFSNSLGFLDTSMPSRVNRILIGLSLVTAGILYLSYLFSLRNTITFLLFGVAAVLGVGANLMSTEWSQMYALGAAILYPSLSSLLMLLYFKKYKTHMIIVKLIISLAIIMLVNGLGMFTVVASLADIRYIMSIEMYRGVRIALFLPILMFGLNYLMTFKDEDNLFDMIHKLLMKHPTYLVAGMGVAGLVVVYIFLTRSGNTPTIPATQFELRVREQLEMMFLARPRFAEILIGYPSLLVLVYLYHRYKHNLILLILGFGVIIGSTNMINSFCHVFTAINISINRTAAGLFVGSIVAVCALAGVIIIEWLFLKWYRKHKKGAANATI